MNVDKLEGSADRRRQARIERLQRIERRKKEARATQSSIKRNLWTALNMAEKLLL